MSSSVLLWTAPSRRALAVGALSSVLVSIAHSRPQVELTPDASQDQLAELDLSELMQLEVEEVVGATRHSQLREEAPSAVTVLTARQIRDHGYRTLAEALRSVPSLHVTYDRNYSYLGVRGFYAPGDYNSRVLLLVDGHRLNYGVYGGLNLGFESPVDITTLERIEVIRGPGSSIYGSNAFFAVINLVTRKGGVEPGVALDAEVGEWGTYLGRARWSAAFEDGSELIVSARTYASQGATIFYDEFASGPWGGLARHNDYERSQQVQARWDKGEWSLAAGVAWRDKGLPTASYGTVFETDRNRTIDVQGYFDLGWTRTRDDGSATQANLRYDEYDYRGRYIYDDTANGGPPDLVFRDRAVGRTLSFEALHAMDGAWNDRLTYGGEVRFNFDANQLNQDNVYGVALNDQRDNVNGGVFAQDEVALDDSTTLLAGLRFDHYQWFGGLLTPRLALQRRVGEHARLKLLYGEAYRAPSEYELYYSDGVTQTGNEDLSPERIRTLEAIVSVSFETNLEASLGVFHNELDDMIVLGPAAGGTQAFDNADASQADGVELELVRRWEGGTRLRLSHSYQDVVDERTGARLPNAPRQLSQLVWESPVFTPRLRAGVELIHVGSRPTVTGGEASSYVLTNLVVRAPDLLPGLELYARAMNLFDVSYADPVGVDLVQDTLEQDGLRVTIGARLSR